MGRTRFKLKKLSINFINFISFLLCPFVKVCSALFLGNNIKVLVYHQIAPSKDNISHDEWTIKADLFEAQIKMIVQGGYTILTVGELLAYLKNGKSFPKKGICITFDDGFYGVYKYAFPVLSKYGLQATIFLATKYVDSEEPFPWIRSIKHETDIEMQNLYIPLKWSEIIEMNQYGIEICSHSHSHSNFSKIDEIKIIEDLNQSKEDFGAHLNSIGKSFVCPYGIWGKPAEKLIKLIYSIGYEGAFLGKWGAVKSKSNPFDLPRLIIYGTDSMQTFKRKINGAYDCLGFVYSLWHRFRTRSDEPIEKDSIKAKLDIRWKARSYLDEDFEKGARLRSLFANNAGNPLRSSREATYYRWKVQGNPFHKGIYHVAEDDGTIVGTTTVTPKRLCMRGKIFVGAEIGDTYTHVDYQHQGIFTALVNLTREKTLEQNIEFIYGTPNNNSLPGYEKKCNFQKIPSLNVFNMVRPLNATNVLRAILNSSLIPNLIGPLVILGYKIFCSIKSPGLERQGVKFSLESSFPDDIYQLWLKSSKNYDFLLERSEKYLSWRFIENPDSYSIWVARNDSGTIGYLVTKNAFWETLKVGYLADFIVDEQHPEIFIELVLRALSAFRNENMDMIAGWSVKNSPYYHILRRFGFLHYKPVPVICYKNDFGNQIIHSQSKWHFTMADSDNI